MLDLIISGGTAVLPGATETADIGIASGRIAAIGAPGSLGPVGAARTIMPARTDRNASFVAG